MSALELCNSCDVPLVLEENTYEQCNGNCFECYKERKMYEIIDALRDYPVFFNIKDDELSIKIVKFR